MPALDDPLSERIRSVLQSAPVEVGDLPVMEREVRRRAGRRIRTRRAVVGVGAVAACVVMIGALQAVRDRDRVVTEPSASSTTTTISYGFGPLTPLVDETLPELPATDITTVGEKRLFVVSEPTKLGLGLDHGLSVGSTFGDPMRMPAIVTAVNGPPPGTAGPLVAFGMTRSEAATVEVTVGGQTTSIDVVRIGQLPQLSFFVLELPGAKQPDELLVSVFDADGNLLTDSERISTEHPAFERAMDDRLDVELRRATITDVAVRPDDQSIELTVHNCGAEAMPAWAETNDQVTVSVRVKLPSDQPDCVNGPTSTIGVGLNSPLGNRTIIDADSGQTLR